MVGSGARRWHPLLALLFALGLFMPNVAWAQSGLRVADLQGGVSLVQHSASYEDVSRALSLEQVSSPAFAKRFRPLTQTPELGFTDNVLWLRFQAENGEPLARKWLLELAYPHLDHLTLYVVRESGHVERHITGDLLPFAQRDVVHPNFVFALENAAHERLSCYLRIQSSGTVRVPLQAWTVPEYYHHQLRQNVVLWMFYGALIMMALYNTAVFTVIRQGEYLTQALLLISMWMVAFSFSGYAFQFLFPDHPQLANRSLSIFMALALCTSTLCCSQVAARLPGYQAYERLFKRASLVAAALTVFVSFAPKPIATKTVTAALVVYVAGGVGSSITLSGHRHPQLRLYLASWYCILIGAPVTVLSHLGVLPKSWLFDWAGQVGCAMQAIFTSLALATRVKVMGDDLRELNQQLSAQNVHLRDALESTRKAKEAAQRATRAKDEFMATMSHELRTPLNAIINVPPGLLEDFRHLRSAVCSACQADFLLEAEEVVTAETACTDCGRIGTLQQDTTLTYQGDAGHTTHHLRKIERSGKHLLQLVNGVLDFSKMEAGRFEISWSELDLCTLLREVVDEMSDLALEKQLELELVMAHETGWRRGDVVRLKQVLLNLLSNAIKFSERAGKVTVGWERNEQVDVVTVTDQGIGIAPEHHERIFARFEQVHKGDVRKYGGTGLGLSISRSLVRLHGGDLTVDSALGQGARFTMRIPLSRAS